MAHVAVGTMEGADGGDVIDRQRDREAGRRDGGKEHALLVAATAAAARRGRARRGRARRGRAGRGGAGRFGVDGDEGARGGVRDEQCAERGVIEQRSHGRSVGRVDDLNAHEAAHAPNADAGVRIDANELMMLIIDGDVDDGGRVPIKGGDRLGDGE